MKRLWIAAGLLVFAVGLCTTGYVSMNKGVTRLIDILDEGTKAVEREDYFQAADLATAAKSQWKKIHPLLTMFLNHHDLADLDNYFQLIENAADSGDIEKFDEICRESRAHLNTVMEAEKINAENVF